MDRSDPELWAIFLEEAMENIAVLDERVRQLPNAGADLRACVDAAFRAAHNLKGSSRIAGLASMESVAHAMEEVLAEARSRGECPPPQVHAQLVRALGLLSALITRPDEDPGISAWIGAVRDAQASRGPRSVPEPTTAPVAGSGEALGMVEGAPEPESSASTMVRVEASRLDELMRFADEATAAHGRFVGRHADLERLQNALDEVQRSATGETRAALTRLGRDLGDVLRRNRGEVDRFGHTAADWSHAIKRARMLPLAGAVARWRVTVAETAHLVGKQVQFVANVGDIEVDRQILDGLQDPIMHLLRNAVDHGIEPEGKRLAAGKSPVGTVYLTARSSGSLVQVLVSDDGAGIDLAAIARKAVASKLLTQEVAARLTPHEVADLLFAAGFSTATTINAVSGRGVGLDVVRRRVGEFGGHANVVASEHGGASFGLNVPATAVSTSGLLVRTLGAAYVIPTTQVARTLRIRTSDLRLVDGGTAVPIEGGQPIRVRWLAAMMNEDRRPDPEKVLVVVITDGVSKVGLVVHDILGEVEFVTKRLPWNVPAVQGVSGAMIMADGAVALVLDAPRLLAEARGKDSVGERVREPEVQRRRRVLVVDDSLTSRTLERNILTAAGYEVETAVDGEAGWQALNAALFDLVVSDVEMPKVNGLELLRRIRGNPRTNAIPVILVTSLDGGPDLAAGAAAGADEYIVKGRFDQRKLLESVARLV